MNTVIIYEKRYPHIHPAEEVRRMEQEGVNELEDLVFSFSEIYERATTGISYIPIPRRMKASKMFVDIAIDVSETYKLDTKIERYDERISVLPSFHSVRCFPQPCDCIIA